MDTLNLSSKNAKSMHTVFRFRMFSFLGALLYPAWHFVFLITVPELDDPLEERVVVGLILMTAFVFSFFSKSIQKHYEGILLLLVCIVTTHFFVVIKRTDLSNEYAITSLVVLFAIYYTFERTRDFLIYSCLVTGLSIYVTLGNTIFPKYLFFASLATAALLSYCIMYLQQRMTKILSERNRFIEGVIDTIPDVVFLYSMEEKENVFCNRQIVNICGRSREHIQSLGSNFLNTLVHADDLSIIRDNFFQLARGALDATTCSEYRILHIDGNYRWVRSSMTVYERNENKIAIILGVIRDITAEKISNQKLEEQRVGLIEAAKMASLGEMAGGVAHEINNPLTLISGSAQQLKVLLQKEDYSKEKVIQLADRIEKTVFRIAKIVKSLRIFARDGSKDNYSRVQVATIVEDALNMCQEKFINHGIKIDIENKTENIWIYAQHVQMVQVLVNLLNNSYDAVEYVEQKRIRILVSVAANFVKISVEDSGIGIPPSIRSKIMQPFFTTKPVGKGTGLGLSISKGIVESHGGILRLADSSDATTFTIELPKAA